MQQLRNALVRYAEDLAGLSNGQPRSLDERASRVGRRGRGFHLQLIGLFPSRLRVRHITSERIGKHNLELDRHVPDRDPQVQGDRVACHRLCPVQATNLAVHSSERRH